MSSCLLRAIRNPFACLKQTDRVTAVVKGLYFKWAWDEYYHYVLIHFVTERNPLIKWTNGSVRLKGKYQNIITKMFRNISFCSLNMHVNILPLKNILFLTHKLNNVLGRSFVYEYTRVTRNTLMRIYVYIYIYDFSFTMLWNHIPISIFADGKDPLVQWRWNCQQIRQLCLYSCLVVDDRHTECWANRIWNIEWNIGETDISKLQWRSFTIGIIINSFGDKY